MKNYVSFIAIIMLMVSFTSCGDDDNNQEVDSFTDCCNDEPVFGNNVDNLDQSVGGEISVPKFVTPNGDASNDLFGIENIQNYPNHTVTIYNYNNEIVFESMNYGITGSVFPDVGFSEISTVYPDGTYKYKVVIENEQTFKKSATFCLFTNNPPLEEQNFGNCLEPGEFDPWITGN
jgi:gliding motility-associated-like protein